MSNNILIGMVGVAGSGKDTSGKIIRDQLFNMRFGRVELEAFARPLKDFITVSLDIDSYNLYDNVGKESVIQFKRDISTLKRNFHWALQDICSSLYYKLDSDNEFYAHYGEYILGRQCTTHEFTLYMFDKFMHVLKNETYTHPLQKIGLFSDSVYFKTTGRKLAQLIGTEFFRDLISKTTWVDIASKEDLIYCDVRFNEEADFIKKNGGILIKVENEQNRRNAPAGEMHESEQKINSIVCDYTIHNSGTSLSQLRNECTKVVESIVSMAVSK